MATFFIRNEENELLEVSGSTVAFKRAYCDQNEIASDEDFEAAMIEEGYTFVDSPRKVKMDELI